MRCADEMNRIEWNPWDRIHWKDGRADRVRKGPAEGRIEWLSEQRERETGSKIFFACILNYLYPTLLDLLNLFYPVLRMQHGQSAQGSSHPTFHMSFLWVLLQHIVVSLALVHWIGQYLLYLVHHYCLGLCWSLSTYETIHKFYNVIGRGFIYQSSLRMSGKQYCKFVIVLQLYGILSYLNYAL